MDVRQLEFFTAVAEERSFTRAAELTFVTQSGLSASVKALERELGVVLFERSARSVSLTPAGHLFLPRARRMLADARAAQRELLAAAAPAAGSVRLGAEQCVGDLVDLVDLLAAFHAREPHLALTFEHGRSAALVEKLVRDDLDLALVALPVGEALGPAARGLQSVELRREAFVLLVPEDHALAGVTRVDWPALESVAFVDFSPSWVARQVVDDAFERRRLSRRTSMTVDDVHVLLDLVRRGFGAAIVPTSMAAKPEAQGLVRLELPGTELAWQVHLALAAQAGASPRALATMIFPASEASLARDEVHPVETVGATPV